MRPSALKTRIFLDSGDPQETASVIKALGFLDGQTTNPTLIAKNPEAQKRLQEGKKFSTEEVYSFYKNIITEISHMIPDGSISIEVYSDALTTAAAMFEQGKAMNTWIPNAHIKYPTTASGLAAAEKSVQQNMRVNMTLCFTQEQAAAVYAATNGAKKGQVFLSPFIGRLDDIGQNGMDLIKNIIALYKASDHHVEVLTASARSLEHFMCALHLGSDIITAPAKILLQWAEAGLPLPPESYTYSVPALTTIAPSTIDLNQNWQNFNIDHQLTTKGIENFSKDWNTLVHY